MLSNEQLQTIHRYLRREDMILDVDLRNELVNHISAFIEDEQHKNPKASFEQLWKEYNHSLKKVELMTNAKSVLGIKREKYNALYFSEWTNWRALTLALLVTILTYFFIPATLHVLQHFLIYFAIGSLVIIYTSTYFK